MPSRSLPARLVQRLRVPSHRRWLGLMVVSGVTALLVHGGSAFAQTTGTAGAAPSVAPVITSPPPVPTSPGVLSAGPQTGASDSGVASANPPGVGQASPHVAPLVLPAGMPMTVTAASWNPLRSLATSVDAVARRGAQSVGQGVGQRVGRAVMLAAIGVMLLAGCQFGAQPAGEGARVTPTVATARATGPTYPAVPPADIPPVVGDGALAVLPAGGDASPVPVTADLGNGWVATVLVAADPLRALAVRLQVVSAETFELPPPDGTALALTIDLYDAQRGDRLKTLASPPAVGIRTPTAVDAMTVALWRLDEPARTYQRLSETLDDSRRTLSAWLPAGPSQTVLITVPPAMQAAVPPPPAIRATAPSVPDGAAISTPTLSPQPAVEAPRAPLPARLTITSIGVDAPIEAVGLEPSGIMASPTQGHVVGWYELGPRPGEQSNAVLAGHVDLHKQPGVFIRLAALQPGAIVDVDTGLGIAYRYMVDEIRTYRAAEAPIADIFGPTAKPTLTLITCGGEFDAAQRMYLDRVVVRAHGA
jgi:sortase (surface protein transpeptidase)